MTRVGQVGPAAGLHHPAGVRAPVGQADEPDARDRVGPHQRAGRRRSARASRASRRAPASAAPSRRGCRSRAPSRRRPRSGTTRSRRRGPGTAPRAMSANGLGGEQRRAAAEQEPGRSARRRRSVANAPPAAVARRRHSRELKSWRPGRHSPGSRTSSARASSRSGRPRYASMPERLEHRLADVVGVRDAGRRGEQRAQHGVALVRVDAARRRAGAASSTSSAGTPAGPTSGRPDACESRCRGVTAARGAARVRRAGARPTGASRSIEPSSAATSTASATSGFVSDASANSELVGRRVARDALLADTLGPDHGGGDRRDARRRPPTYPSSRGHGRDRMRRVRFGGTMAELRDTGGTGGPRRGAPVRPAARRRGPRRLVRPPPRGAGDRGATGPRFPTARILAVAGAGRRALRAVLGDLRHAAAAHDRDAADHAHHRRPRRPASDGSTQGGGKKHAKVDWRTIPLTVLNGYGATGAAGAAQQQLHLAGVEGGRGVERLDLVDHADRRRLRAPGSCPRRRSSRTASISAAPVRIADATGVADAARRRCRDPARLRRPPGRRRLKPPGGIRRPASKAGAWSIAGSSSTCPRGRSSG